MDVYVNESRYFDTFDPNYYLYVNPDVIGLTSVERAYAHYVNNVIHGEKDYIGKNNRFNPMVYYRFYIDDIKSNTEYIDNDLKNELINTDIERVSTIHYDRVGRNDIEEYSMIEIDINFNPSMYRTFHQISDANLNLEDLFFDYVGRKVGTEIVIGNIHDLIYTINTDVNFSINNVNVRENLVTYDTVVRKDLKVLNKTYLLGGVHVSDSGMEISGGTIELNNYGSVQELINSPEMDDIFHIPFNFEVETFKIGSSCNFYETGDDIKYLDEFSNILVIGGKGYFGDFVHFNGNIQVKDNIQTNVIKDTSNINTIRLENDAIYMNSRLIIEKDVRANEFVETSDKRIKHNIEIYDDIDAILKGISSINVCKYDKHDKKDIIGLIAQDVQQYFPDCVHEYIETIPNISKNVNCYDNILKITEVDIRVNDILELRSGQNKIIVKVVEVNDEDIMIDKTLEDKEYYCVGKIVDDMLGISYNKLFSKLLLCVQHLIKCQ